MTPVLGRDGTAVLEIAVQKVLDAEDFARPLRVRVMDRVETFGYEVVVWCPDDADKIPPNTIPPHCQAFVPWVSLRSPEEDRRAVAAEALLIASEFDAANYGWCRECGKRALYYPDAKDPGICASCTGAAPDKGEISGAYWEATDEGPEAASVTPAEHVPFWVSNGGPE